MLLHVDPTSPVPIYDQIAGSIRGDIARGALAKGERLPSARDVAESLDVNLHTVLKAYQHLRDEGLIDMRRGRGAVVARGVELVDLSGEIDALIMQARRAKIGEETLISLIRERLKG